VNEKRGRRHPRVFAITLNWNGGDDTVACVESLQSATYPRCEIVVVDNGSVDDSVSNLKARYPEITVIENGENLGYARGFNVGLAHAYASGGDFFLILNSDTVLDSEAIAELVKVAERDERIGFVSGKVYWYTRQDVFQTVGRLSDPLTLVGAHVGSGEVDRGQYEMITDYDFIDDVFLLVRREVYETIGGYDPNFFLYYEETDWCARVRRAGFRIVYAPKAKIWHKGQSGDNVDLSPSRYFYLWRNMIVFMHRNASSRQFRRFLGKYLWRRAIVDVARFAKNFRFAHASAYVRGIGSGMWWLLHAGAGSECDSISVS